MRPTDHIHNIIMYPLPSKHCKIEHKKPILLFYNHNLWSLFIIQ